MAALRKPTLCTGKKERERASKKERGRGRERVRIEREEGEGSPGKRKMERETKSRRDPHKRIQGGREIERADRAPKLYQDLVYTRRYTSISYMHPSKSHVSKSKW